MEILYRTGKAPRQTSRRASPMVGVFRCPCATSDSGEEKVTSAMRKKRQVHLYTGSFPRPRQAFSDAEVGRYIFRRIGGEAVVAFLSPGSSKLSEEELQRLELLVEQARKENNDFDLERTLILCAGFAAVYCSAALRRLPATSRGY